MGGETLINFFHYIYKDNSFSSKRRPVCNSQAIGDLKNKRLTDYTANLGLFCANKMATDSDYRSSFRFKKLIMVDPIWRLRFIKLNLKLT